jgi:hypothetical protein
VKDELNWNMEELHAYAAKEQITNSMILDWLNLNLGAERRFWYGQRTIREAVLMAVANGIGVQPK